HDPLTGIGNRRALAEDLPMFLSRQREAGEPVAVLLCDVDHFKAYNDTFGHLAGDRALTTLTAVVRGVLRADDAAYRFGGEELLVILRGGSGDGAREVAERIRAAVAHAALPHPLSEAGVLTVSVGLAGGLEPPEELIARADVALYAAKEGGRNRVVEADVHDPATPIQLHRDHQPEEPAARHVRSMLAVSRAAASGRGAGALLDALSEAIRVELSFGVVAVNLLGPSGESFRVRAVSGDPLAREQLLDTETPVSDWENMAAVATTIHDALWLPAGRYDHDAGPSAFWRGAAVAAIDADGWHPDDMLLLPLRGGAGALLGFVSVDQPLLGRRPTAPQIGVLMAVVDHAGIALEQLHLHEDAAATETAALRLAAVLLLAETLDLRDPSTGLHSRTVGSLACGTALALGLDRTRVDRIRAAGVLHDLGKLGIPDAILQKPGALDDAEWREMRRHPEVGARILEHAGLVDIAGWVRAHHERVDGRGYPRGLGGAEIPLEARILSVADSFEAMVTDRPYRCGMPVADACAELLRCAGSQFDPEVVDAFLRALDGERSDCDFIAAPYVSATPVAPSIAAGL
ncbi:MAG TPA: diguanylate cyclase, partial [Solirubrobacteraceae bacterium]|nr:diguanylate cyclase [Solirubrobacteraceae bacterium]